MANREKRVYKIVPLRNYGTNLRYDGEDVRCYSKKQMKALYPEDDYVTYGECVEKSNDEDIKEKRRAENAAKLEKDGKKDIFGGLLGGLMDGLGGGRKSDGEAEKAEAADKYDCSGEDMNLPGEDDDLVYDDFKLDALAKTEESDSAEPDEYIKLNSREYKIYHKGRYSRILNREAGFVRYDRNENNYITLLKSNLLFIILAAALIIALNVGIVCSIVANGRQEPPPDLNVDPNAEDWQGEKIEDEGGVTAGIRIPGYKNITIAANKKTVAVNLYNPEKNNCYFVISIILTDTDETIYKSDLIEPGKGLYSITLTRSIARGVYNAKLKYETYSLDDMSPLNGAEIVLDLIAQ